MDFVKTPSGAIINNNKSSLREAKKQKKLLLAKAQKIKDLEDRISKLEKYLPLIKDLINGNNLR